MARMPKLMQNVKGDVQVVKWLAGCLSGWAAWLGWLGVWVGPGPPGHVNTGITRRLRVFVAGLLGWVSGSTRARPAM